MSQENNRGKLMQLIHAKLQQLGYTVNSSIKSSSTWYATRPNNGEAHAVILQDDGNVKVNDISGRYPTQRGVIEKEVKGCLKGS